MGARAETNSSEVAEMAEVAEAGFGFRIRDAIVEGFIGHENKLNPVMYAAAASREKERKNE